ncbi:hypothetical protein [Xanthovirga aplysinae]|uniref:hypothetical protein n=1 Tax=Xanthovirga aplysinae TaxID=2529853 RepID=UPI0012BC9C38|nr:hypothetical protein [Xanthovirga aplysinae]MTI30448.1 hypothetical protein [Xanthovirga aplysinae]
MKTLIFRLISAVCLFTVVVMINACKSSKKAPKGEVELTLYCTGKDFTTDKKHFRANAIGESLDQMTAKKRAYSNAQTELAGAINLTVKAVVDNYVNSRELNNQEEVSERFETLSRQVIDQRLSGIRTICEKHTKTAEGKFKTYLAIELSAEELATEISQRLSSDERLKIDYDYEKFKKTFEEEMNKLRQ